MVGLRLLTVFLVIVREALLRMVRAGWLGFLTVAHVVYHRDVYQVVGRLGGPGHVFAALCVMRKPGLLGPLAI